MLVHIVLGSVPGPRSSRNRLGFVRLFESAAHQAHEMSRAPPAASDH